MLLIDANAILRYTLSDNADMANRVLELITKSKVTVRYEVWAEVVYVHKTRAQDKGTGSLSCKTVNLSPCLVKAGLSETVRLHQ